MMKDRTFPPQTDFSSVIGLASPKDRLAAFILDGVILLPIIQLFQAPFKRGVLEALLSDSENLASQFRFMNVLVVLFIFFFYQSIMTYWKGQSLGKMFFHLKVISYQGNLSFLQCLQRSALLIVEFFTFGWLWSAMFSHPLRRVFHDRSADTLVISTKSPAGLPSRYEVFLSRAMNGFFGFVFLIMTLNLFSATEEKGESIKSLVFGDEKCEQVKEKFGKDIEDLIIVHLERGVSSECLYDLARKKIWKEEDKSLSHFAMALALKDSPVESRKYLNEICKIEKQSSLCHLAQWLGKSPSRKRESVEELQAFLVNKEKSRLVDLSLAMFFSSEKKYEKALRLLSEVKHRASVDRLKASMSFHNLLHLEKFDQAYWVYQTHPKVDAEALALFYKNWPSQKPSTIKKHLQFLEKLGPHLKKRRHVRGLASTPKNQERLLEIYEELKGRL